MVVVPSLVGASFATIASLLRRRYGPWALLAVTVVGLVLAVAVVTRLHIVGALFFPIPEIPGVLVAASVLEWRARRASGAQLWRHVVWGVAAFDLAAVVGLMVMAASVSSTGWVGLAA